ncbi:MAG: aldolase/citrate lyase family protein [Pseudomonadota bacterium]
MSNWNLDAYASIRERYEARRLALVEHQGTLIAGDLPLRFLRQEAHLTTPASNREMVFKAIERGSAATARILDKFGIATQELADRLGVPVDAVEKQLAGDPRPPLVMVDGEDAQALRDDVIARGRENAVASFREADWNKVLRFYRPSGLNLKYCIDDLIVVLTRAAEGVPPSDYPVDGIIWPKAEHPEELEMVSDLLGELEDALGLERNRIKMQFLVESGRGAAQLIELVKPVLPRLTGIIFGIADYAADVDLPVIRNDHPVCDWARAAIINVAGAVGVPAIDNMTINYPVADKALSTMENKVLILDRLKEAYDDAAHGQALGMDGKWVGHPAQLFVVRLAYARAFPEDEVLREVAAIEAYTRAIEAEQGATIIGGAMCDRAMDRHTRRRLRKAVALGYLDPQRALRAGIITGEEAAGCL